MSASDTPFLETERLIFRRHLACDEEPFVMMHTDDESRRYVGGRGWPSAKARLRFREQFLGKPTSTYGLWATVLRSTGAYIGMCGLTGSERDAHLAYYIARSHWGQHIASEAAHAFVDVGFKRLRLPEILASVERGNVRSERILNALGFRFARGERIEASGRTIDHYALPSVDR